MRPVGDGSRSGSDEGLLIFLVRHGETPWHAENRYCGRTDLPLTERGREQAEGLARWAADVGVAAVHSSTLTRARETAAGAARAAGVPHHVDPRLVELDFGLAEGHTPAEMRQRWPAERAAFERDPVAHPLPGGEDPKAAMARGAAGLDDIVRAHPGGPVLVVCHGTLLRLLTCCLTGIDPSRYRDRFPKVANTSGAVLRAPLSHDGRWKLLDFNPSLSTS
ncbi:MAG: histidine phosphatase family protein [Micromonosporaceae bacterium]|nr:histidine phosphatase family protein [Micromonosporaceae bacterium]